VTLIDSHAHLDLLREPRAALERARQSGVEQIITIGIDLASSQKAANFADREPGVFCTVGLHPHDASQGRDSLWPKMKILARQAGAVGIGECGLDFFRNRSPRAAQMKAFAEQIEMARELELPLVIHDREAHEDVIAMLREHQAQEVGGVVHCFSGGMEEARQVLDLGFYLGITGTITYPKNDILRQVARFAPKERLLVETDCPFLTPVPKRGQPNEPAYVSYTAQALALVLEMEPGQAALTFTRNTRRLFNLPQEDK
jgi:TatD DNase family protein